MKAALQIPVLSWLFAGTLHPEGPVFATILGGSGQDFASAVASGAQGNVYVTGLTYSPDFRVAVQASIGGVPAQTSVVLVVGKP